MTLNPPATDRHGRSLGALGLVAALLVGVAWAATRSDGREGTETVSNDGGAWLLKRESGAIGHLNREVLEVTTGIRIAEPGADIDIDQAPGMILVHDRSSRRLVIIDDRTNQTRSEVTVPEGVAVRAMTGGVVVYDDDPLRIWRLSGDDLLQVADLDGVAPTFESESAGVVAVNTHLPTSQQLTVMTDQTVHRLDSEIPVITETQFDVVATALTTVGATTLAVSPDQLVIVEGNEVRVTTLDGGPFVLQQPGPQDGHAVLIDDSGRLIDVVISSGDTSPVALVGGDGHLQPISHDGCVFTVATEPPTFTKFCDGELVDNSPLLGAGPELRLRLVNGWVWINDIETGGVWLTNATTELSRIDDWGAVLADERRDGSEATVEEGGGTEEVRVNPDSSTAQLIEADQRDDDDENEPPVARDDENESRVDRPALVSVLDNDEDADGDVLLVDSVEVVDSSNAQIWPTRDRSAVQVTPAAGFTGSIEFFYTVSDGRGGEARATGTVLVSTGSRENNRPPLPTTDVTTARAGSPVSLNVLTNDSDPDGDSLALVDISGDGGILVHDPSGRITFTPDTTGTNAQIELTYTAVDDYAATAEGRVVVNVRLEDANSRPDARNDSAITSVGSPARINLLENDLDPDDDALIVARQPTLLRAPANEGPEAGDGNRTAKVAADGEFFFIPTEAGTYLFDYLVSDGQNTDLAQVRVDATAAGENHPPVAIRDDVAIPIGGTRLIHALENDGDPDGDVVGIVEWSDAGGLTVEEVPGVGFRVTVEPDAPDRVAFRYAISDGIADPVATMVVVSVVDTEPVNQPPVVTGDAVEARAGRSTTVPVLINDYDPEGAPLTITRAAEVLGVDAQFEIGPLAQTLVITVGPDVTDGFSLSYDVTDPDGASSAAVVDVRVLRPGEPNRPPVARPDTGRTSQGVPLDLNVLTNDDDPDGDTLRVESIATQPRHGTIEINEDGAIRYSPRRNFTGTDRFTYVLVDTEGERSVGQALVGVTPTAVENRPPSANNDRFLTFAGGGPVALDVIANDFDPDNDRIEVVSLTETSRGFLELSGDGQVLYTPPDSLTLVGSDNGELSAEISFSYQLSDGRGSQDTALVRVGIEPRPRPQAPLAFGDRAGPTRGNRQLTVDVLGNDLDPDGEVADLIVSSEDPAVDVVDNRLLVTVGRRSSQHRYTITDPDGLASTAVLTVFVVDNEAPSIARLSTETPFETPVALVLTEQVSDPDDDVLYFVCCDDTQGGVVEVIRSEAGVLDVRFVPSVGFHGEASFAYRVDDRAGHLIAETVSIEVLPPDNRPPAARDVIFDVEAGSTVQLDLSGLATDPDGGGALDFSLDPAPSDLNIDLTGSTLTVGAPIDGSGTSSSLGYIATDALGAIGAATVTVRIVPVAADLPQAITDNAGTSQGQSVEIDLVGNDMDPLGQGLILFQIGSTPAGSTTAGSSPGTVLFTPDPEFFGAATFTYTLRDAARTADREVVGQVTVDVIGRPEAAAPPVANAENAEATITWSTPTENGSPIDSYRIEHTSDAGRNGQVDIDSQNSFNWAGLTNGDDYRFRLRAHNLAGWGEWSEWSSPVRPDTRPRAPATPAIAFADGELKVAWKAPSNPGSPLIGYRLEIGGGDNQVASLGATTAHIWRNLTNGVEYQFRVAAVNAAGDSDWSDWSTGEHPLGAPLPPSAPATTRGNRYLDIGWTPPDDNGDPIIDYEIEMRASGQVVSVSGGGTTSYRWASLANGVAQEFRVRASNRSTQPGVWSAWSNPTVPCSVPTQPASPNAARGDQQATIGWDAPGDEGCAILSYSIRVNGSTVQTMGGGSTSHVYSGLTNGTGYTFEIQALNEEGAGPWSPISDLIVPAGPPTAPRIDSIGPTGVGQITLSWSGAGTNGSPITNHEVSIGGGNPTGVAGSSHAVSGLADSTDYPFRVRACNEVACGPWSGSSNATTWGPPSAPLAVNATAGDATWQINWSTPANNGGSSISEFQYRVDGGTVGSLSAGANRLALTGQANGVPIRGEIRSCNAVGCSSWGEDTATPTAPPPAATVAVGGPYSGSGCLTICHYIQVDGVNFPPASTVNIVCHSSLAGAFSTDNLTSVAGDGSVSGTPCFYGYPGETVWVVVNGVTSNSITWP